ncbi:MULTISPECIES: glucosaminidase domain-containing protein [unclassified Polaribacter]|uniref:glucosaminidase domain-containing protein n=1 Tax=unclassified Polaribacter TaxID=196858 RepID=UPI0011BD66E2|nr:MULTISPECIES: glucosaminidase domain-containing protein [unclassified Polaribacter]TXD53215.1 LysM peptidoglycan-binding domain-containing protein [Polaribacter sp. IC063]TXD61362.1 LysM peptidoglycan-binding domain-containing protein [Polaribacter sp. IC066]
MKLRFLVFLCAILFLASCGSKKRVVQKKNSGVVLAEPKPEDLPSVDEKEITRKLAKKNPALNSYTLAYIRKYASIAVREMHEYKIPASITLAQGILESGKGRSVLALKSNNHFGIKCHTQWTGERVYHDDDEKGECFRKYQYPETSYHDHSLFLTQRKRYAFLFEYHIRDYKKWAYGLRKAGYATDTRYPAKLLKIIRDYKLHEFDKVKKKDFIYEAPNRDGEETTSLTASYYEVKKGDTLYAVSRKFNISVNALKKLNNLKDNTIVIGQKLVLQ